MSIASGGITKIEANTTTPANGASVAAYLITAAGAFLTSTSVGGAASLNTKGASEFIEDTAHVTGDYGTQVLAVRSDAGGSLAGTDGDYAPLQVDASGRLRVLADLTAAFDFVYAEDSAAASGDSGAFVLGVRNDANATLTSADGDYSPMAVDSAGRLKVVALGIFAEDSAAVSGDSGAFMLAVRRDTTGSSVGAAGDYSELQVWSNGDLKTVDHANSANLQAAITVGATAVAIPTTPLTGRKNLMIQNTSNFNVYLGSATVTASGATKGILIGKGAMVAADVGPANLVYAISDNAAGEVVVWEMS